MYHLRSQFLHSTIVYSLDVEHCMWNILSILHVHNTAHGHAHTHTHTQTHTRTHTHIHTHSNTHTCTVHVHYILTVLSYMIALTNTQDSCPQPCTHALHTPDCVSSLLRLRVQSSSQPWQRDRWPWRQQTGWLGRKREVRRVTHSCTHVRSSPTHNMGHPRTHFLTTAWITKWLLLLLLLHAHTHTHISVWAACVLKNVLEMELFLLTGFRTQMQASLMIGRSWHTQTYTATYVRTYRHI